MNILRRMMLAASLGSAFMIMTLAPEGEGGGGDGGAEGDGGTGSFGAEPAKPGTILGQAVDDLGGDDNVVDPAGEKKPEGEKSAEDPAKPKPGEDPAKTPEENAKDKAKAERETALAELRGAPEGGTYPDYVLPDGAVADPKMKTDFDVVAKDLDLSHKGAQKLVDHFTAVQQAQSKRWFDTVADWRKQTENDPEIGGAKFEQSSGLAVTAINTFGDDGLKKVLNDYGLGNHPAVVKAFVRIGSAMGEGRLPSRDSKHEGTAEVSTEEAFYGKD